MKKILFTCLLASVTFLVTNAQSKLSKKERASKAKYAQIEKDRQQKFADDRLQRLQYDSLRHAKDSIAQYQFDSSRVAWKDSVAHHMDSVNTENYKSMAQESEHWNAMEKERALIHKSAKLNEYQISQARFVNQQYREKAAAINADSVNTAEQKAAQLAQINAEREAKLKTVLGKSKARKLEKARKAYVKKNGSIEEDAWIETASSYKNPEKSKK